MKVTKQPLILSLTEIKMGQDLSLKTCSLGQSIYLALFLKEKQLALGIRFHTQTPSVTEKSEQQNYNILSLPLYMIGQDRRFITNFCCQSEKFF